MSQSHRIAPSLSIVIPVYNEEENLRPLWDELKRVLRRIKGRWEVIFVDDGSEDRSASILEKISRSEQRVRVLRFMRNFGQTAAMAAGIDHARGDVIVSMDADLQNDPADIPRLIKRMEEGYDLVSGWRRKRRDPLNKRIPSVIANWLISLLTGIKLHDYGCTLKAYSRNILKNVHLYGEMHRFIPVFASWAGARIAEEVVNHRPRGTGKTKYGLIRTFKVLLDLITIKFLSTFSTKPIYLFGGAGMVLTVGGIISGIVVLIEKYQLGAYAHRNPLLLLAIFLFLVGFQLILMGLIAELLVRTYHESQQKPIYILRPQDKS